MRRNTTFARGTHVPAATLNALQDEQLGLVPATDAPATLLKGADLRWWTTPDAGIADGILRVVDASIDWKNRRLLGLFRNLGAAARRPGQADDHVGNDPTLTVAARSFDGWTGAGAVGAASATVVSGVPPVLADDAFAVVLDEGATAADRVYLFARPSDGALCIYNDSGATLHADLLVLGAGEPPSPSAPPPDVIPTLTEVQWLTPSLAAARPADPGGPAVHRATDTGAITLFDGGAWRDLGGTSGTALPDPSALSPGHALMVVGGAWTVVDLYAGPGLPLVMAATTVEGDGTEKVKSFTPITPFVSGRRYRINGVICVWTAAGAHLATIRVTESLLTYTGSAWAAIPSGETHIATSAGIDTYFARAGSTHTADELPGLFDDSGALSIAATPLSGQTIRVEFRGTVADFGASL